ncbi:hypothetical protein A2863_02240 [Candidatus Woesebacteria bacterium RIFCSPHIGHO2_01_FULL_38_9b]|uniref:Esterase n=1 Tax=Candidatus Woesebacteria bacterium RIFCSPHIGHO2_01_FULL_38_9b TaxID=1802493 RepID=A0A1F7Y6E2_9BACT|nr:MAG: hypothetical protein A2863_02240 [Candidatus Woesebacteria bacterium RIFCSPHIGHO2_01_FULL_38_9b]
MTFLLIHGSFSTPNDSWLPWLSSKLKKLGKMYTPAFPVDRWSEVGDLEVSVYNPSQDLEGWFKKFEEIKQKVLQDSDLCIVAHSIGPLFTLHLVEKYHIKVKHAFFVAPFFEIYGKSAIVEKANATFYKKDFDFAKMRSAITNSSVIYSDDDPYVNEEKSLDFANKVGSKIIKLSGLGHMGIESNLKEFPILLELIERELQV